MDDDAKYYTIQIKGTAYRFTPVTSEDVLTIQTLSSMGAGTAVYVKALMDIMSASVGDEQWKALIDRVAAREVRYDDLFGAFKRLAERQGKDLTPEDESASG